jgi:hypothetical protein
MPDDVRSHAEIHPWDAYGQVLEGAAMLAQVPTPAVDEARGGNVRVPTDRVA